MDCLKKRIPLEPAADLTKTSYELAVAKLLEVDDVPLALIASGGKGFPWEDLEPVVPDSVSVHGLGREVRKDGKPYHVFPIEWDAWILVGKNGNVIFSEGA